MGLFHHLIREFIIPSFSFIFCMHEQKECRKCLEMKSTAILNILALLLFEN